MNYRLFEKEPHVLEKGFEDSVRPLLDHDVIGKETGHAYGSQSLATQHIGFDSERI